MTTALKPPVFGQIVPPPDPVEMRRGGTRTMGHAAFEGGKHVITPQGIFLHPFVTEPGHCVRDKEGTPFLITSKEQRFGEADKRLVTTFHFVQISEDYAVGLIAGPSR